MFTGKICFPLSFCKSILVLYTLLFTELWEPKATHSASGKSGKLLKINTLFRYGLKCKGGFALRSYAGGKFA